MQTNVNLISIESFMIYFHFFLRFYSHLSRVSNFTFNCDFIALTVVPSFFLCYLIIFFSVLFWTLASSCCLFCQQMMCFTAWMDVFWVQTCVGCIFGSFCGCVGFCGSLEGNVMVTVGFLTEIWGFLSDFELFWAILMTLSTCNHL